MASSRVEGLVAVGLAALAVAIRAPGYLLSRSFWLDEGWVVDSVRAPLHQLELLTSSTPIGWTLLLRLVPPVGGPERYRLLPLAFAALTALAAWRLGSLWGRGPGGWARALRRIGTGGRGCTGCAAGSPGRPRRRCWTTPG